jgi:hypothetical protein
MHIRISINIRLGIAIIPDVDVSRTTTDINQVIIEEITLWRKLRGVFGLTWILSLQYFTSQRFECLRQTLAYDHLVAKLQH